MTKRYTPKILIKYLIEQFLFSLFIFFCIFFSLIFLSNFIGEIFFLKEKNVIDNLVFKTIILSLIKSPSILINFSPFIFLFSGIFYFVKLLRNNEITPLSLSGFSNNFITLVPSCFSFFLGVILILVITPFSSNLTKYYEISKQKYISNDNLIIMSETGLWVKGIVNDKTLIIRADRIENENFNNLKNITIFEFRNDGELIKRLDAESAKIFKDYWKIVNAKKLENSETNYIKSMKYITEINIENLKNYFINPNTFSFWNINKELQELKERGYYGQELIITFHKFLSLPLQLFAMIIVATIFTIKIKIRYNNFMYIFLGIFTGICIYFLTDLSIAFGKSGRLPLIFSIWVPVITVMLISIYSLIREND